MFNLYIFFYIISIVLVCLIQILNVAYLTLLERKILSAVQKRKGPNKVGIFGVLQPIADAFKLILKEINLPSRAEINLFFIGPIFMLWLSLMCWVVFSPTYGWNLVDIELSILYLLSLMGLNVYGFISAGWASNSKYSFLGAIRASAQMLGYELTTSTVILCLGFISGSFNIVVIIWSQQSIWYFFLWPLFILFLIGSLAETARVPFDLPEAESELVAGYNVEYSSITFAFFFLAEYGNIIVSSNLLVCLFMGGYLVFSQVSILFYLVKLLLVLFIFVLFRATLPRFRFDQLMTLGWLILLPLSFVSFVLLVLFLDSRYSFAINNVLNTHFGELLFITDPERVTPRIYGRCPKPEEDVPFMHRNSTPQPKRTIIPPGLSTAEYEKAKVWPYYVLYEGRYQGWTILLLVQGLGLILLVYG